MHIHMRVHMNMNMHTCRQVFAIYLQVGDLYSRIIVRGNHLSSCHSSCLVTRYQPLIQISEFLYFLVNAHSPECLHLFSKSFNISTMSKKIGYQLQPTLPSHQAFSDAYGSCFERGQRVKDDLMQRANFTSIWD